MSQEKQLKHGIRFAWHVPSERVVTPAEVANGLACQCVCVACNAHLIARQGEARIWHFAHYHQAPCPFGAEAAIHWMAKQIISERGGVFMPPRYLTERVLGPRGVWAETVTVEVQKSGFQLVTDCQIEKSIGRPLSETGYRRPDLVAQLHGRPLAIEIHNTHAVDLEKTRWLSEQGFSVLEIDVSDLAPLRTDAYKAALEQRFFATDKHSYWRVHAGDQDGKIRLEELAKDLRVAKRSEEEALLAQLDAAVAARKRLEEFRERNRDIEDFKVRHDGCTLRVGRNRVRATVAVYGYAHDSLFAKVVQLVRQHGGKFNPKTRWWEFYANNETKVVFDRLCAKLKEI